MCTSVCLDALCRWRDKQRCGCAPRLVPAIAVALYSPLVVASSTVQVLQKETGEGDRNFLENQVIFIKTPEWDFGFKEENFE